GGSFEELYAFNTELVARAILDSKLPVVTALGHTSDRTVADLVGDAECRTPTEAGARVVPKKSDLVAQLRERARRPRRRGAGPSESDAAGGSSRRGPQGTRPPPDGRGEHSAHPEQNESGI